MNKKNCNGTTHSCCNSRLKKEGGNARCCSCEPHDGCDFDKKPKGDWEEKYDAGLSEAFDIGKMNATEYSKKFIAELLTKVISEAREEGNKQGWKECLEANPHRVAWLPRTEANILDLNPRNEFKECYDDGIKKAREEERKKIEGIIKQFPISQGVSQFRNGKPIKSRELIDRDNLLSEINKEDNLTTKE